MMPVLPDHHPQKFPSSVVDDLRDYAASLGLPTDWHRRITTKRTEFGTGVDLEFNYEGKPLATYHLDVLGEIDSKQEHCPIPTPPDPLVIATEHELSQPTDPQLRRFKHLVFRPSDVMYVNNVSQKGTENGADFAISFCDGKVLLCGNERDYANSGMSTFEWFLENVMQLRTKRTSIDK